MNFSYLLALLILALATVVQTCGDCAPEGNSTVIARAPETRGSPSPAPAGKEKKDYYKVKEKKDKKEDKKKEYKKKDKKKPGTMIMDIKPSPAPAPAPSPSPSGSTTMDTAPSPGNNVMQISPSPTPSNPLAINVRDTPNGVTIEECQNGLGAFKAQAAGTPQRIAQCVCCQFDQKNSNFANSCGQDTSYPFTISPFNYCKDCQDIAGCQECFIPDPAYSGAGTPPCVGSTQIIFQPSPGVIVDDIDGSGPQETTVKVCPPVTSNCLITRGGITFELTPTGFNQL